MWFDGANESFNADLIMWKTNKCIFVNMLNHILLVLFFTNMLQSHLWPSSGFLIMRILSIYNNSTRSMIKPLNGSCFIIHYCTIIVYELHSCYTTPWWQSQRWLKYVGEDQSYVNDHIYKCICWFITYFNNIF